MIKKTILAGLIVLSMSSCVSKKIYNDLENKYTDLKKEYNNLSDEIEDLSFFEVADQRTFNAVEGSVAIYPCRELLLTPDIKHRAIKIKDQYPAAAEMLEKINGTV